MLEWYQQTKDTFSYLQRTEWKHIGLTMNTEKTASSDKHIRRIVLGILAHVDAGKTTLSESLLYLAGSIRKQGRVDHGDAYLDTDSMEKARGITIFSKQAELTLSSSLAGMKARLRPSSSVQSGRPSFSQSRSSGAGEVISGTGQASGAAMSGPKPAPGDLGVTLLDTPGHADFSPDMERTLSVLDYALLLISAPDGVTGQVKTLWKLLSHYRVPVILFVNKMDQPGMDRGRVLSQIQSALDGHIVPFPDCPPEDFDPDTLENIALADDVLLESYLESGKVPGREDIAGLIRGRKLFPVYFGSALKNEGVDALARGLMNFAAEKTWGDTFAAKVFKISRDEAGTRLAFLRILGGRLKAKMEVQAVPGGEGSGGVLKIDQIRLYSGSSFETLREAEAGRIVCAVGLKDVRAGQMLTLPGAPAPAREDGGESLIMPVLRSQIILDEDTDPVEALKYLRALEEEEPMLAVRRDSRTGEISADIMGQVETEIIADLCLQRYGMHIAFGPPSIVYRETIAAPVEGVGHYEPLRHYAEVHVLLEPAGRGTGIQYDSRVSTDSLSLNWQRLVLSSLMSMEPRGVLTGSMITDMKITLTGGRASEKHTEGGDFRQASIRALRQGLMSAESILLEPWYSFEAEVPQESVGRLMSDIQSMDGRLDPVGGDGRTAVLSGSVPAAGVGDYAAAVRAYTHGEGRIAYSFKDYEPCRDPEKIILEKGYDPASDLEQPVDSVFCSHGAGVIVPWDQVRSHMHVDTGWRPEEKGSSDGSDGWSLDAGSPFDGGSLPGSGGQRTVRAFTSDWQAKRNTEKKDWKEEQRELSAGENELRRIFEHTYRGSSWTTPLHASTSDDISGTAGVWSRDGSLEKSLGLKSSQGAAEASGKPAGAGNGGSGRNNEAAGGSSAGRQGTPAAGSSAGRQKKAAPEDYLLVDGYNIIFAWPKLRNLASINLDSAAGRLIEILADYHGTQRGHLIVVFDAYKVHGGRRRVIHQSGIDVIYTREAETADSYIMEMAHSLSNKGNVTVATGDGIVQMIIFSAGARRMSAAELKDRIESAKADLREKYHTDR